MIKCDCVSAARRWLALLSLVLVSAGAAAAAPQVEIKTSQGNITLELYPDKAPKTVDNFLRYAKEGFYNGTIFHRVIGGFMIQGGGFTADMQQKKTREPVANEAANGLKNDTGTVAMARTRDPHSATAQFFINVADNAPLNFTSADTAGYGYTVFGRVVKGMDVVNKIAAVQTGPGPGGHGDVPRQSVVIEAVTVLPAK
jgi:peptidyl-prolyl cis-trans isomerase A (cyclophilin A)/peptidyl-prolyl cis-trans isomerase B (cyclophilin B)